MAIASGGERFGVGDFIGFEKQPTRWQDNYVSVFEWGKNRNNISMWAT